MLVLTRAPCSTHLAKHLPPLLQTCCCRASYVKRTSSCVRLHALGLRVGGGWQREFVSASSPGALLRDTSRPPARSPESMELALQCSDEVTVPLLPDEAAPCRVLQRFSSHAELLGAAPVFPVPFSAASVGFWKQGPCQQSLRALACGLQVRLPNSHRHRLVAAQNLFSSPETDVPQLLNTEYMTRAVITACVN